MWWKKIKKNLLILFIFCIYSNGSGLTHEQLLPFINDPWWIKVRYIVFFMYWAIFVVIFIMACIISILNLNQCSLNMLSTVNTDQMISSTTTQSSGSIVSSIVNSSTAQTTIDAILSPLIDIVTNSSDTLSKLN